MDYMDIDVCCQRKAVKRNHSLSKLYLFVRLFACLTVSLSLKLLVDDANLQTLFVDYIGCRHRPQRVQTYCEVTWNPFWYISMGFGGVYLELDLSTARRRLKSPPGNRPIHYPIHPPTLVCFPARMLPSSDYTAQSKNVWPWKNTSEFSKENSPKRRFQQNYSKI